MSGENEDTQNTELEAQFRKRCETVVPKIDAWIMAANKARDEAVSLADEHGIPFYSSGVSSISQAYVPSSFERNGYNELDSDLVEELTGISSYQVSESYGGGWQASQIC